MSSIGGADTDEESESEDDDDPDDAVDPYGNDAFRYHRRRAVELSGLDVVATQTALDKMKDFCTGAKNRGRTSAISTSPHCRTVTTAPHASS